MSSRSVSHFKLHSALCPALYTVLSMILLGGLFCALAPDRAGAETPYMSPVEGLYLAVIQNDLDEATRLMDQGQDPNETDPEGDGCTVLTYVGSLDMLELLLKRGADPNHICPDGLTSLHRAVAGPNAHRAIPVVLDHGGQIDQRYMGDTALHWAVIAWIEHSAQDKPHADGLVVRQLAEAGADLDATDNWGMTALMTAAQNDQPQLVGLLLELGADPSVRDPNGLTALDMAREMGVKDVVKVLEAAR